MTEITNLRLSAIMKMLILMNEKHDCKKYKSENKKRCKMCDAIKHLDEMR